MLGKVYLSYLHIDFQIYRLLGTGSTARPQPELLRVSASMLETVVQMANAARNRASFTPRDLPGIVRIRRHLCLPDDLFLLTSTRSYAAVCPALRSPRRHCKRLPEIRREASRPV
jgi:hypothetical protein